MTVARAARILAVTLPTARKALVHLEERNVIERTPSGSRRHLYVSRPVMDILYA